MLKRILMNAADTSPGNGAPVDAPSDVPANAPASQAQGTPAAVTVDDFKQLMSQVGELAKSVNSLHAADRRAREGKQPASPTNGKPSEQPTADDSSSQLALRDAFDDATSELKLTKGQRSLLRDAVMSKRPHPSDVDGFVQDYASKAGWMQAAPQPAAPRAPAPPAAPAQPTNAQPVSDRGAPPAPQVPLNEMNPYTASESDREAFIKKYGNKAYVQALHKFGKGRTVAFR